MSDTSPEENMVHVWVGSFASPERRIAYFDEKYGEDRDDEEALSEFAAGQGESFYDHDELEINFRTEIEPELRSLLEPCSYSSTYLEAVLEAYEDTAEPVNILVLFFGEDIEAPRSVSGPDFALRYLGQFPFDDSEDSLEAERPAVVPAAILLELQTPGEAYFEGRPVRSVAIDARGLVVGCGVLSGQVPYLDLAGLPGTEGVVPLQLRIYRDQFDQWVVEDLGRNGLTSLSSTVLNGERSMPWHGDVLRVGPVKFRWNCFPEGQPA
jgi:hypothetical protein